MSVNTNLIFMIFHPEGHIVILSCFFIVFYVFVDITQILRLNKLQNNKIDFCPD
jgi:hypothetical protein